MSDDAPELYHRLSRAERDYLIAVGSTDADASGQAIAAHVGHLRGDRQPSPSTTYTVLGQLTEWGLIDKHDDGAANTYTLTDAGRELRRDGAQALMPD